MQGIVTDAATGKPLYAVTVVNTYTQQASLTDAHGLYVISANKGDLITFSFIGYKTVEHKTPPAVIVATANITMEQTGYELKEFRLTPGKWTKYQIDSAERQVIYKLPLQRTHPNAFTSPVSAIAELFSKSAKRAYEFQKNFAAGEIEKFTDSRYTLSLTSKLTGLTGDTLASFMNANPIDYQFARAATDLEIKMWIRYSYKEWLTQTKTDSISSVKKP